MGYCGEAAEGDIEARGRWRLVSAPASAVNSTYGGGRRNTVGQGVMEVMDQRVGSCALDRHNPDHSLMRSTNGNGWLSQCIQSLIIRRAQGAAPTRYG